MSAALRFLLKAMQEDLAALHAPEDAPVAPDLEIVGQGALASRFPVTDLATASIATAAQALRAWTTLQTRLQVEPPTRVDQRMASLWFGRSLRPLGWQLPPIRHPVTGDYQGRDGWIRLHANAPHHRQRALTVLGARADPLELASKIATLSVWALEEDLAAAGACAAAMRTRAQWMAHPQGQAVAGTPLFIVRPGSPGEPAFDNPPDPARPLAGIHVLDLTRVLAGPVATRFLAGYGAQVLRIDPPSWTEPGLVPEVTPGKHCAGLNLTLPGDRAVFKRLLAQADILVHGYRPEVLSNLGFDDDERQRIRPGLIDISLNAWGWAGPWSTRRGFDSLVQMSCGIADAGMHWCGADRPTPLPVQGLDQATGYLMAAAALHALVHLHRTGTGHIVRLALARTAELLLAAPAHAAADLAPAEDRDFEARREMTAWGPALRLLPPCQAGASALYWTRPACDLRSESAANFSWDAPGCNRQPAAP